jgi:hypothetical protein
VAPSFPVKILPDGKEHAFTAGIYPKDDVEKFLRTAFK